MKEVQFFFNFCHQGFTIAEAIELTAQDFRNRGFGNNAILDIYYGNSNRYFCIDGKEGTI